MAVIQKINIYDTDTTTITGIADDVFDVAFVPGFTNKFIGATVTSEAPSFIGSNYATQAEALNLKTVWYDTNNKIKYKLVSESNKTPSRHPAEWAIATCQLSSRTCVLSAPVTVETTTFASGLYNQIFPDAISLEAIVGNSIPANASIGAILSNATLPMPGVMADGYMVGYQVNNGAYTPLCWVPDSSAVSQPKTAITLSAYATSVAYDVTASTTYDCTTSGAMQYALDASSLVTLYECTEIAHDEIDQPGWHYIPLDAGEYDYTDINQESLRYNSYAEFAAAVGNTPLCIWKYKIDNLESFISFLSVDDFVKEQIITKEEYSEYNPESKISINSWKKDHLTGEDAIAIDWVDRNWLYAAELLRLGIPVFYNATALNGDTSVMSFNGDSYFIDNIADFNKIYAELADKGEYNIKYLTTGAFDVGFDAITSINTESAENQFRYSFYANGLDTFDRDWFGYMSDIAGYRKDCLALLDCTQADCLEDLYPSNATSVYGRFAKLVEDGDFVNQWNNETYSNDEIAKSGRRCGVTFPWWLTPCFTFPAEFAQYRQNGRNFVMPGSFAYLKSLADSITKYESASWEAIAGVTRALVPDLISLYVSQRLSNAIADAYNDRALPSINAITNIRPYGYCIWGNRTLVNNKYFASLGDGTDGLVASSFVDIMSMVCNINKVAFRACKRLMFEKDNDKLWIRFMQIVSPYMDQLATGGAVRTYEIKQVETTKRGHLAAKIIVWPYYAIDSIDVEIVLRDTEEE